MITPRVHGKMSNNVLREPVQGFFIEHKHHSESYSSFDSQLTHRDPLKPSMIFKIELITIIMSMLFAGFSCIQGCILR